jgi:hypothetical protein
MMRILIVLCIYVFFIPVSGFAAPCYGTTMPEAGEFFGGGQTHVIFKRYLEDDYGKVRSTQHFFQLSYGVYDWLSIDLKGGAGNIKAHPIVADELDYTSSFAGGYGLRLRLLEKEQAKVVFGFQHISVHPQKIYINNVKNKAVLDDWQVSLLASYGFSRFRPYIGTKWSRLDYIHWVVDDRKRKMSDLTKDMGLVCGFDLPVTERVWLNIEGQAFDVEALAVSVNFKF